MVNLYIIYVDNIISGESMDNGGFMGFYADLPSVMTNLWLIYG